MSAVKRGLKDYLIIALKGMCMGAADIVPGVSGGTVALITGVYEELLESLKKLTPAALLNLKDGIPAFWSAINGNFLLALFAGILLSIKTLAGGVSWALDNHPLLVWGAFSGLISASLFVIGRKQGRWAWTQILLFLLGAAFVVGIAEARPSEVGDAWWIVFMGGFIAICAMILPGISGSFILLLLGLYTVVLKMIETLDFLNLGILALGCISGLLVFSRFLSWLLTNWYKNTLAVMLGFLLGSLYVTWPWKQVLETFVDRHGETVPLLQQNVLPHTYELVENTSSQLTAVLISVVLGALLVLIVEFFSSKYES